MSDNFSSQIELELTVNFNWSDSRLNITGHCLGFIDNETIKEIWIPRPYIPHLSYITTVGRLIASTEFFQADPDLFHWELELVLRLQCPFDFSFYPFDVQLCQVKFTSYFHTDDVVRYSTRTLQDLSAKIQQSLEYNIEYKVISSEKDLVHQYFSCAECSYSVSGFCVKLRRKLSTSIINLFIPSLITVMIAFCRY